MGRGGCLLSFATPAVVDVIFEAPPEILRSCCHLDFICHLYIDILHFGIVSSATRGI